MRGIVTTAREWFLVHYVANETEPGKFFKVQPVRFDIGTGDSEDLWAAALPAIFAMFVDSLRDFLEAAQSEFSFDFSEPSKSLAQAA
jgi:hypothetical protein